MLLDSGICEVYGVSPKTGYPLSTPKARQQYGELSVGFARNGVARQNNERVDMLVRILRNRSISTFDRCRIDEVVYWIRQVQHKTDEDGEPVTDLSLEQLWCDGTTDGDGDRDDPH